MDMKKIIINGKNKFRIILLVIILIQLLRIVYSFSFLKEGTHSDEIWSYGLANSYYEPFIYDTFNHGEIRNNDQWLSGQIMKDYLTVDSDHKFSYDSVYFNQVYENHPFFYYCLLHTVCSFFPGRFSLWYGFVINIIAFVVTILFFYKLIFEVFKSEVISLIGCSFYGFSLGALNTFIFVRMYALLVMLTVIFLFLHAKLYNNCLKKSNLIAVFLVTLLGMLTHHFFIPFAASVSACFCVYYLIKKKTHDLFKYSFTMLGSVVASLMIFPATFNHMFSDVIDKPKYTYSWQFVLTLNCVATELFGVRLSPVSRISYTAVLIIVICIIIMFLPVVFLVRNETWFKYILLKIKNCPIAIMNSLKMIDLISVTMFVSSLGLIILTSAKVSVIGMGPYIDRYVFFTFPGFCVVTVRLLRWFVHIVVKRKRIVSVVLTMILGIFCLLSNKWGSDYFFQEPKDAISVENEIKESNCVFITNEYWLLTCFAKDSMNAENVYAINIDSTDLLRTKIKNLIDPPKDDCDLYYYVDNHLFYESEVRTGILVGKMPSKGMYKNQKKKMERQEFESLLKSKYLNVEYIGNGTVFQREYSLYKVG